MLALAPLLERAPRATGAGIATGTDHRVSSLARLVGVTPRTVHRWAHEGVPVFAADRAAAALDDHPCLIWGEAWWVAADAADWSEVERSWWQWDAQRWAS